MKDIRYFFKEEKTVLVANTQRLKFITNQGLGNPFNGLLKKFVGTSFMNEQNNMTKCIENPLRISKASDYLAIEETLKN